MPAPAFALLAVALAAPAASPPASINEHVTTRSVVPARPADPAKAAPACTKFRAVGEKSELATEQEVQGWASAALARASLLDEKSPCWLQVRITAGALRAGGRQDGWHAHVALSTRRYAKDGKVVANERGMLLVEAEREALAVRARALVEDYVARLAATPGGSIPSDG